MNQLLRGLRCAVLQTWCSSLSESSVQRVARRSLNKKFHSGEKGFDDGKAEAGGTLVERTLQLRWSGLLRVSSLSQVDCRNGHSLPDVLGSRVARTGVSRGFPDDVTPGDSVLWWLLCFDAVRPRGGTSADDVTGPGGGFPDDDVTARGGDSRGDVPGDTETGLSADDVTVRGVPDDVAPGDSVTWRCDFDDVIGCRRWFLLLDPAPRRDDDVTLRPPRASCSLAAALTSWWPTSASTQSAETDLRLLLRGNCWRLWAVVSRDGLSVGLSLKLSRDDPAAWLSWLLSALTVLSVL